jgi:hypothetical protein
MRLPYTTEAIMNLRPGTVWKLLDEDYDKLEWDPQNSETKPTKEEIETEAKRLAAVAEANKYKLSREKEYPPLSELADALYWQQNGDNTKMETYLAKVDAVKEKYPKG